MQQGWDVCQTVNGERYRLYTDHKLDLHQRWRGKPTIAFGDLATQ